MTEPSTHAHSNGGSMYDIHIGHSTRELAAPVILTVATETAAQTVVGALNRTQPEWVDGQGLKAFARAVDRGAPAPTPDTLAAMASADDSEALWSLNVDEVRPLVAAETDPDAVTWAHETERENPKYEYGRAGVMNACEERLGELSVPDPHEDEPDDDDG